MAPFRFSAILFLFLGIFMVCTEGSERFEIGAAEHEFSTEEVSEYPSRNVDPIIKKLKREVPKSIRDKQAAERIAVRRYNERMRAQANAAVARARQAQRDRLHDYVEQLHVMAAQAGRTEAPNQRRN